VRAPEPKEHQLQIALVEHLKYRARPGVIYFHIPNGGERTPAQASLFKAMGVLPGVSDLQFLWKEPGPVAQLRVLFLELKVPGGKPSRWQEAFKTAVEGITCYFAYAYDIDEALAVLECYGLLRKR
jgi:hypothetical protein